MKVKTGIISVLSGSMKDIRIPIKNGETILLGKDPKYSNLVFSNDYFNVSRVHCSITYNAKLDAFYVVDSSTNGTYISNKRLIENKRTLVPTCTELCLANSDCLISLTTQEEVADDSIKNITEENTTNAIDVEDEKTNKQPKYIIPIVSSAASFILVVSIILVSIFGGVSTNSSVSSPFLTQDPNLFPEQDQVDISEELIPTNIKKTIMIYLVASDLESQSGAASLDILEMLESDVDTQKNNILIYTGGTKQWVIDDIPSTQNCIYKLENGTLALQESFKSSSMGNSDTLSQFLKYGMTNFSAEKYGLIL